LALLLGAIGALLGLFNAYIDWDSRDVGGSFLGVVILPLFGFFVPWGLVHGIAWMIAGFSRPPQ